MTLEEFFEELESKESVEDYIVTLKYKYDHEEEYTIANEILQVDLDCKGLYAWLNDWNEGQTDVEVLGYIPLSEVITIKNPKIFNTVQVVNILYKIKDKIDKRSSSTGEFGFAEGLNKASDYIQEEINNLEVGN